MVQLNVHQYRKKKASNSKTQDSTVTEGKGYVGRSLSLDNRKSTIVSIIMNVLATSKDLATACTFLDNLKSSP